MTALLIDRRAKEGNTKRSLERVDAKTNHPCSPSKPPRFCELNVSQDPSPGPQQGTPDARRRHLQDGVNQIRQPASTRRLPRTLSFARVAGGKYLKAVCQRLDSALYTTPGRAWKSLSLLPEVVQSRLRGSSIRIGDRLASKPHALAPGPAASQPPKTASCSGIPSWRQTDALPTPGMKSTGQETRGNMSCNHRALPETPGFVYSEGASRVVDDGQHIRLSPSTPLAELDLFQRRCQRLTRTLFITQALGAISAQGSYLLWA
ncbi:hypothetical protein B0T18DRAFT_157340 [Schizothecium vesticola]|uniref:Uncharacterized protein n=1 Tax=Schizothecium vesticola TaxID=314040 RepID=A0AA40EW62_9PEZI|nr:hypothetical protein B0T18DRAFT_157340 [Schizothecium vesticola]